ncbi:acetyl-CoA carboxylase biotin carboxylase subunit [bacterium]|nr:acetyl-CoA carboxylase biotin carboxylase subunit [bacterium]
MKTVKINKVLIANRGEIAVRIMRTCRAMGIKTVAVFSEADRNAFHVQMADEAYCIGPAASVESYLVIDKLIDVAKKTKADAIHPGYGFLSEKAPFSKACQDNNIIFLGPDPMPIERMGDKIQARHAALEAKVPMIPGTKDAVADVAEVKKLAKEMGFPILLKAAAGGGGKGMRIVEKEADIESAFERATSEAKKAFNDGTLFVEKYLKTSRHIEVQVACDKHGNGLHLYERECSIQRRHQKVVEEAPFCFMKPETRAKITEAALRLCKKVNYSGVGTLEFLMDEDQNFYFLEMNTRLQVEHPVTEMITGLDLVQLQIEIGEGKPFRLKQEDIKARGAALEVRLYAEDPENNFFPSPGTIEWMTIPEGPGVRHDTAVYPGATIPIFYDPMIAKLIVWGDTREQAIQRMQRALGEYEVGGFKNNIWFLRNIINNKDFKEGTTYTRFLDDRPELMTKPESQIPLELALAVAALDKQGQAKSAQTTGSATGSDQSPWKNQGLRETLSMRF